MEKYSKRPGQDFELDDETDQSLIRNEQHIIELLCGSLSPAVQYACLRHFDGSISDEVAYTQYLWVATES